MNLSKAIKVTVVEAAAAAAQTELVTDVLDMQGYDGVMFIALTGDVTTASVLTLTVKGKQGADGGRVRPGPALRVRQPDAHCRRRCDRRDHRHPVHRRAAPHDPARIGHCFGNRPRRGGLIPGHYVKSPPREGFFHRTHA